MAVDLHWKRPKHFLNMNLQGGSVHLCTDWILLGPQGTSVFPRTLLSTWSVGHCVLPSLVSFPSSFLLFLVPSSKSSHVLTENHHSFRTRGTLLPFQTSDLFSWPLLCFCCAWLIKVPLKAQQFLWVPPWNLNMSLPECFSTELWAPNHVSADCHCWSSISMISLGES